MANDKIVRFLGLPGRMLARAAARCAATLAARQMRSLASRHARPSPQFADELCAVADRHERRFAGPARGRR